MYSWTQHSDSSAAPSPLDVHGTVCEYKTAPGHVGRTIELNHRMRSLWSWLFYAYTVA